MSDGNKFNENTWAAEESLAADLDLMQAFDDFNRESHRQIHEISRIESKIGELIVARDNVYYDLKRLPVRSLAIIYTPIGAIVDSRVYTRAFLSARAKIADARINQLRARLQSYSFSPEEISQD